MVYQQQLRLSTDGNGDLHNLTESVQGVVTKSNVKSGTVHVFAVGSTAGIATIEFEPGLQRDLPALLNRLIPPGRSYGHEQAWHDGNAHSHLQATIVGPDVTVPFREGKLSVGTWQQIVHVEFDTRAREREVVVTVQGE